MKTLVLCLLTFLCCTRPLRAESTLTLGEALETAVRNHPLMIEANENLQAAEARSGQAAASYYPQLSLAADWSRGRSFIAAQETIRTTEAATAALYLKQTLFDFGRTGGAVDAARANRGTVEQARTVTRQDVVVRVRVAFYQLLAAQKQVSAVAETVTARTGVYRQALEFLNQGIRARVDVARAEANLYAAKTALIRAENNRDIARLELADAMGLASLGDRVPQEPAAVSAILPDRARIQQEALRRRPELLQLASQSVAATANLATARSGYLPLLSATANAGYADREMLPTGNVWGVGLNLTVPLFSGFSSVEQVKEATAALNSLEARRNNLKLQITREAETAWLGAYEASARMASTNKEVAAASESKALAEARYQEGIGSIIEVTDAQSLDLEARTANIQAGYDYYSALARLDRAVGNE